LGYIYIGGKLEKPPYFIIIAEIFKNVISSSKYKTKFIKIHKYEVDLIKKLCKVLVTGKRSDGHK
jgi:hypothetical protein